MWNHWLYLGLIFLCMQVSFLSSVTSASEEKSTSPALQTSQSENRRDVQTAEPSVSSPKKILFLSSYSIFHDPTSSLADEIQEIFLKQSPNLLLDLRFLGNRNTGDVSDPKLLNFLPKITQNRYDLIITTDLFALNTLLDHQNMLPPGIPIVFTGLISDSVRIRKEYPMSCGIICDMDFRDTARLIQQIYPKTARIIIASDGTRQGEFLQSLARKQLANLRNTEVLYLSGTQITYSELIRRVSTLPDNTAIILNPWLLDAAGMSMPTLQSLERMITETTLPVFTNHNSSLGTGTIGGVQLMVNDQAELVAHTADQILNHRKSPADFPIMHVQKQIFLDYSVIKKMKMKPAAIPKNAQLINHHILDRPTVLWRMAVATLIAVSLVSLLFSLYLLKRIRRKRRLLSQPVEFQERLLKKKEESSASYDITTRYMASLRADSAFLVSCAKRPARSIQWAESGWVRMQAILFPYAAASPGNTTDRQIVLIPSISDCQDPLFQSYVQILLAAEFKALVVVFLEQEGKHWGYSVFAYRTEQEFSQISRDLANSYREILNLLLLEDVENIPSR